MWKDKLLKKKWRVFVIILYVVMIASIILRFFPLTESFSRVLTGAQIWAAVCFLIFAWLYYYKPELVKKEEVE